MLCIIQLYFEISIAASAPTLQMKWYFQQRWCLSVSLFWPDPEIIKRTGLPVRDKVEMVLFCFSRGAIIWESFENTQVSGLYL